jgi:hypothetical protein
MRRRHLTTAITLLVLLCLLAIGAVVGVKTLFAPVDDTGTAKAPTCVTRSVKKGQRLTSAQVQVSVFNAGTRAGYAGSTMSMLTKRGFKKGTVGNAPEGSRVKVAQVWVDSAADVTAARLVARQLGPAIKVKTGRTSLGPGIDVVIGDGFDKLAKAKRVIVASRTSSVCLPTPTPSGG